MLDPLPHAYTHSSLQWLCVGLSYNAVSFDAVQVAGVFLMIATSRVYKLSGA